MKPSIGFSCWHCPTTLECGPVTDDWAHDIAGANGWVIGHFNGQGHYACSNCASTLFDAGLLGTEKGRAGILASKL